METQVHSYDRWRDTVRATHEAWDMPSSSDRFSAVVRTRRLGSAELIECECNPCSGRRGKPELATTKRATTGVLFILAGQEKLSDAGQDTFLHPGQFVLWDTTRPLAFEVPRRLHKLTLMLPADLAAPVLRFGRDPVHRSFDADRGCGALLLAQLRTLASMPELDAFGQEVALRGAIELLAAAVGGQLGSLSPSAERVVRRAEAIIQERLHDPQLSVHAIAERLGLSRRQLDRSFAEAGRSASRTLWSKRLERCRRDILQERNTPVSAIAYRWGFSSPAHFSRAFRAAFGASPRQYRAVHAATGGAASDTARKTACASDR